MMSIELVSLVTGHIEILANNDVHVHLFDIIDSDHINNVGFDKIIEHKVDPNHEVIDEADISSCYSLSRKRFIKELKILKITTIRLNGDLIDREKLVLA